MSNAIGVELEDEGRNLEHGLKKVLGVGEQQAAQPTTQSTGTSTTGTATPDCGSWNCEDPVQP